MVSAARRLALIFLRLNPLVNTLDLDYLWVMFKPTPWVKRLIISLVASFLVSLLFLRGKIDQDFFSFYYIGKGVANGMNMFRDFADNKGPVFYIFFTLLNLIFKDGYLKALIFSSTLLDAISVFLMLELSFSWFKVKPPRSLIKSTLLISFLVLIQKSFSIGINRGGVYSETLSFFLLMIALYLQEKTKDFFSGVIFCLSIFSRPTFVLLLPIMLLRPLFKKVGHPPILSFFNGFMFAFLAALFCLKLSGSLNYFIENVILFNLNYAEVYKSVRWLSFITTAILETRILIFILGSAALILTIYKDKKLKRRENWFLAILFFLSLASFVGVAVFDFHHAINFSLFLTLSCILAYKYSPRVLRGVVYSLFLIFSLIGYAGFLLSPIIRNRDIAQVVAGRLSQIPIEKRYIQIIPHYPEVYLYLNKNSPDRYFQVFFLSKYHNTESLVHKLRHQNMPNSTVRETLFVLINVKSYDKGLTDEYLQNFAKPFKLRLIDVYSEKGVGMETYVSEI